MISPIRISVIMPLYNKAPYVTEAIESVLQQSHPAWEIIVIDDGSSDGGPELVKRFGDTRIKLHSQANAGVSVARNRGIDIASGNYIAFLDADDRYQPGFLAKIVELITKFPDAGMLCTAYTCFWDNGDKEERCLNNLLPDSLLCIPDFYSAWTKGAFTYTSAIVIASRILKDSALHFPNGEKLGEDQDLWFRVAEQTKVAYANTSLADYRMGVQGSATQGNTVRDILPCYRRLSERLEHKQVPAHLQRGARRLLASHVLNIARANLKAGSRQKAARFLLDRRAFGNPFYLLRTALAVAFSAPQKNQKS
ncbi:MAG: glycosyltransferase [Azonexus sp.]|nr:glycosyltransferase [Azonexus sp.]